MAEPTSPTSSHRRTLAEREEDAIEEDLGAPGGIRLGRISSQDPVSREPGRRSSSPSCDVSAQTLTAEDGAYKTGSGDVEKLEDVKGYMLTQEGEYIWVDFAPDSHADPMSFKRWRKWAITIVAIQFTFWTSYNVGAYASGEPSMERDLGATSLQAAAGLSVYAWGFAIAPLFLAPLSEDFGRRPLYIVAGITYWLCYFGVAAAKNIGTVLVLRFLAGVFGSVGATVVGGSLADIWSSSERGSKMSLFAFTAVFGTSFAPVINSWIEANPRLEWRWIQWIQIIIMAAYLPSIYFLMPETRGGVILSKKAIALRKERGLPGGATFAAREQVGKAKLTERIKLSLIRPIHLLVTEPVVLFFSIWIAVGWGILYGEIQGIPYIFQLYYNLSTGHIGLVYLSLAIGIILAFAFDRFYQERMYAKTVATRGAEARLYAAMVAGVALPVGCFILAWTARSDITLIAPCIGLVVILFGIFAIYLASFNYLADSYQTYASSALAGQSFLRNMVGGSFPLFSVSMYKNLTPPWASSLFGFLAVFLGFVPFVAFFFGPQIRARSPFSKRLLAEQEELRRRKEAWAQEHKVVGAAPP